MKRFLLFCLISLTLFSCQSNEKEKVFQKQDFHYALDTLYPELREGLYRQTTLPTFTKEGFGQTVEIMIPKSRSVLKHFREDDRVVKLGSWTALHKALEHYRMAHYLWKNQRGVSLVMNRIREANRLMEIIPKAYADETGGGILMLQMITEDQKSKGGSSGGKKGGGGHG